LLILPILAFMDNRLKIDHLSALDVETIVSGIKPEAAILTHFGLQLWQANPTEVAAALTQKTGIRIIAAQDGLVFNLDTLQKQ
jgi:hypothetical protein